MIRFYLERFLQKFFRNEEGASFTEYGLLLVVVVLAVAATGTTLGTDIIAFLDSIGTALTSTVIPQP